MNARNATAAYAVSVRAPPLSAVVLLVALGVTSLAGCYESRVFLGDAGFSASSGVTRPCTTSMASVLRDCGWRFDSIRSCVPGTPVSVACGTSCASGSCSGDAMIRLCRGTSDCTSAASLGQDDDSCGSLCPRAEMTCPPEGRYTVLTTSFTDGSSYTCSVGTRP